MHSAYYAVLRTYWRRLISSWMSVLFTFIAVAQILATIASPKNVLMPSFTWGAGFIGLLLWTHFRELIVGEPRRLLPQFARPQVVVLGGLLAIVIVVWPALMMLRGATVSVGSIAYAAAWMAILGWWVLTLSIPLFFIAFALWMWSFSLHGMLHLRLLFGGQEEAIGWAMLAASVAAIVTVIQRMLRLTEEMPLYHRRPQFGASSLKPRMTGETNRAWAEAKNGAIFGLPSLQSWTPSQGADLWSRTGRWRVLTRGSTLGLFFMALFMVIGTRVGTGGGVASPVLLTFLIWMPSTMVICAWLGMWRYLEAESLRPIRREAFLQEVGLTIGLDLLRGWLAMAILIAADSLLLANPPADLHSVLTWTIASLLLQVLAYGVAINLMRYRSPMKAAMGTMLALLLPAMGLLICAHESVLATYQLIILGCSLVLALLGWALIRDAYRRWRVTELG